MTTAAPRPEDALTAEQVDERIARAWTAYRAQIQELTGDEYERAERDGWEQLQEQLRPLERRRDALGVTNAPSA